MSVCFGTALQTRMLAVRARRPVSDTSNMTATASDCITNHHGAMKPGHAMSASHRMGLNVHAMGLMHLPMSTAADRLHAP